MVQTRSATRAGINSNNDTKVTSLEAANGDKVRVEDLKEKVEAAIPEEGKSTDQGVVGPGGITDDDVTRAGSDDDVVVISCSLGKSSNQIGGNMTPASDRLLSSKSAVKDKNKAPKSAEGTPSLRRTRSVTARSKRSSKPKKLDILATPVRRSRRLASLEIEKISKETEFDNEEIGHEEVKEEKVDDIVSSNARHMAAVPLMEAIAEEVNESENVSLGKESKTGKTDGDDGDEIMEKANKEEESRSKLVDGDMDESEEKMPDSADLFPQTSSDIKSGISTNAENKEKQPKISEQEKRVETDSVTVNRDVDGSKVSDSETATVTVESVMKAEEGGESTGKLEKPFDLVKQRGSDKKVPNTAETVSDSRTPKSSECFPDWDEAFLISRRRSDPTASFIDQCIGNAYSMISSSIHGKRWDSGHSLLLLNEEVIWQQLNEHNRELKKMFHKLKYLLNNFSLDEVSTKTASAQLNETSFESVNSDEEEYEEGFSESTDGNLRKDEVPKKNGSNSNLFDLGSEDLENVDTELKQMDEDGELSKDSESDEGKKPAQKFYRKSIVDDRFFSLSEMEAYLDEQDRKGDGSVEANVFEQVADDDEEDGTADYKYAEFYGESDYMEKMEAENDVENKKRKRVPESEDELDENLSQKKKVHFEVEDKEDGEQMDDEHQLNNEERVLFGAVDNDEKEGETAFQKRQKKLKAKIAVLEEENLAPRSWELSGEVTAMKREENSLLEKDIDYDYTRKIKPVITVDKTQQLEALIAQRIKDKAFDDVTRKIREPDTARGYRAPVKEDMTKKSLAEVYEEEYQKSQNPESEVRRDERKVEIERRMKELFFKIDTLFHYSTNPPEVRPEVSIVTNMASLRKEEVGPLASTEEMLVAPEEVKRHERGEVKSNEERTDTDRARERRKKKKLQKLMDRENRRNLVVEENTTKGKTSPNKAKSSGSVKSSTFFKQLHENTVREMKEKSKKVAKKNAGEGNGKINASAKFIL